MESNRIALILIIGCLAIATILFIPAYGYRDGYIMNLLLSAMHDVMINNPVGGQVLTFDSTSQKWINDDASGVTYLNNLTDVDITSPATNTYLRYNGTYWVDNSAQMSLVGLIDAREIKTSIGTVYSDIPTGCGNFDFAWDCLIPVDCQNGNEFLINFIWQYRGTGIQSVRWVSFQNSNDVFVEVTGITQNHFVGSTNIFTKPSWCTSSNQQLKMQGKSTVSTDSPISYGYEIRAR